MWFLIRWMCVLALGLAGCGSSGPKACDTADDCDDGIECSQDGCRDGLCQHDFSWCPCEAPLSDYCAPSECPTLEEAIADMQATCEMFPWGGADTGQCGGHAYVAGYFGTGSSSVFYFDNSGTLVARRACTDCNCIECSDGREAFCIEYGPVPDCELEVGEVVCEPGE